MNNANEEHNIYSNYDLCIRRVRRALCAIDNSMSHLVHARNTAQWVDTLIKQHNLNDSDNGDVPGSENVNNVIINEEEKIRINLAAFANDLQYAGQVFGLKVSLDGTKSYTAYRAECHKNSAALLRKITQSDDVDRKFVESVCELIVNHENGLINGKEDISCAILRDADALSYFDVLCTFDIKDRCRGVKEDVVRRFEYEYRRLSKKSRQYIVCFRYSNNKVIDDIMQELVRKHAKELQEINGQSNVIKQKMVLAENIS